ncbi:hypothetical protein [Rhodococcus kronopolitis]|uniref:Apea-like HEPN domain-containing protein n=1 Tax=Rhodococcus kronopolitis TaxID=1460226 RepID=A0ABV9FND3_9NOCA
MTHPSDFANWDDFLESQGLDFRLAHLELTRACGTDFLDFICAFDGKWGMHNAVPTDVQRAVIAEATALMTPLLEIADSDRRRIAIAQQFGGYVSDLGTSRATDWHVRCGGRVPETADDSTVEAAFRILARDFLGFRLLGTTHISAVLDGHPVAKSLFSRFTDDEPLGRLFEEAVAGSAATGPEALMNAECPRWAALFPLWSDGNHSTLQFHTIPGDILNSAVVTKYATIDVVEAVQESTIALLDLARCLSAGETVTATTYVGLAGLRLEDEVQEIGFERIRLRRSTPLDPGCLNGTSQVWTIAEIDTALRCLDNKVQESSRPGDPPSFAFVERSAEHTEIIEAHHKFLASQLERLRFSVLLSSGVEDALATTATFSTTANPMTGTATPARSTRPHNSSAHELSREIADSLSTWLPRVMAMPEHLSLPMRRLLRAAAERDDPVDSLVDAVVCWEGLFGANPEIKFQVTGAMSVLLEPSDMEKRQSLYKVLGDIYGRRSQVVHGSVEVGARKFTQTDAAEQAQQTVSLGIAAFRAVLESPHLTDESESRLRSRRILLGF